MDNPLLVGIVQRIGDLARIVQGRLQRQWSGQGLSFYQFHHQRAPFHAVDGLRCIFTAGSPDKQENNRDVLTYRSHRYI